MPSQPLSVFISYSHRDEALKQELEDHLALLKRQGKVCPWQDRQIEAGTEWNEQIREALDAADVILCWSVPDL
ncbi:MULTISPECIES: toll/interleukin-1 receptor domain-containing protein [Cyanophyceae]|uniref:Toll/interleukin-1 receptor domain-containing protein n=1 Tax=Leptolyngbya subtilissima DQ-A4 TaxID=2933933 RepID=A0ABV0KC24_9CYAN|nr:toll/interleukin-1 receptor domain-containing protein [Nodosilinea sp. FACHB-141]